MSHSAPKNTVGRKPIFVFEIKADRCPHTYGVSPCTAGSSVGQECFNTFGTCQDKNNYAGRQKAVATGDGADVLFLATDAFSVDDVYNGMTLVILDGDGRGQVRTVTDYIGSTRQATVDTSWTTLPGNATYLLYNTKTYRYCDDVSPLPPNMQAIPCITGFSFLPTKIESNQVFTRRATFTIRMKDMPHHDGWGIDPYVTTRGYDPATKGTYWKKWLARNIHYLNREAIVRTGYIVDNALDVSENSTDLENRYYVVDRIEGPNQAGDISVTVKDQLVLSKNSVCPKVSLGELTADLDTVTTTFSVASGDGAAYDSSGSLVIGKELMTFTRVDDDFTVVRAASPEAHSQGDTVQQAYVQTNANIVDVVKDLLFNFTDIPPQNIPETEYDDERDTWLSVANTTVTIGKPTEISKLLGEISEQYALSIFDDDKANEVKLSALKPPQTGASTLTDSSNIVDGSYRSVTKQEDQYNEVLYHYNMIDPLGSLTDPANFATHRQTIDPVSSNVKGHGSVKLKEIFSRWVNQTSVASTVSNKLVSRSTNPPKAVTVQVDAKDSGIQVGNEIILNTQNIQDQFGDNEPTNFQVASTKEIINGTTYELELITSAFDTIGTGAFCYIVDSAVENLDYDFATEEQKEAQPGAGWIVDSDSLEFSDGRKAYKII